MKLQLNKLVSQFSILSIVIVLLVSVSCDNFLAEKPKGEITPNQYFKSDKEAKVAVSGLYYKFQDNRFGGLYNGSSANKYSYLGADVVYSARQSNHFAPIQNYTISAGYGELNNVWGPFYNIIKSANLYISKIEDNKNLSEDGRNKTLGQALFIRAMCYYKLTTLWGDVPYYRKNLTLSKAGSLSRTDKTKIWKDLVKDLIKAANILPSKYDTKDNGRADKWAAKTLLAHVNLWLKDWKAARDAAVDVVNNSHYRLLDNYADVFDNDNEYNDEIIWQASYDVDLNPQTFTERWNPHRFGVGEPKYEKDDEALTDSLNAHGMSLTGYNQYCVLPDLYNSWPDDDKRKQASAANSLFGIEFNNIFWRKNWNLKDPRGHQGSNLVIYRLADDYLMAAEAENELNGPANAYQYINKVRKRAFDPDKPLSGLSKDQFRKAIYNERKWELAAEGFRRLDLIRWGILIETVRNTNYPVYKDAPTNIQPYNTLLPIPAQELERNPNLTQNPGYGGQK